MRRNLETVGVPFPARLMSSARTATAMTTDFAREILNMYALQNGAGSKRNGFVSYGNTLPVEAAIIRLFSFVPAGGNLQILAVADNGKIYLQTESSWAEKYSGLSSNGHVRAVPFNNRLILTNGVDDVLEWDGITMSIVFEYVEDLGANLTYVSANQFTIESTESLYQTGYKIKATLSSGTVESAIAGTSESGGVVTVTLASNVLDNTLSDMAYEARPPKFTYITAAHDRLWGIGIGPLKATGFAENVDRMRVFYTDGVINATDWYNASGVLQSIGLADKAPLQDELVAMAVKDNVTVFFGKNHTQLWHGVDPTLGGDMSWSKTIPVGAVHGDLVQSLPNDIAFFTRSGVRTLSRVLQTEQLDVGDIGSEIDPTITAATNAMQTSDAAMRNVQTFAYQGQGWFGFRPSGKALVYQLHNATAGWTLFDGYFEQATASLNTPDSGLIIALNNKLYQYNEETYSDNGLEITCRWWTPWLTFSKNLKRWANKTVEVLSEQGAALVLTLRRYKNYDSSSYRSAELALSTAADYWDEAAWNNALWDNGAVEPAHTGDKCVSDALAYTVENASSSGPLTIYGLKLHGRSEK